jgi:putative ABC transport system permease protein
LEGAAIVVHYLGVYNWGGKTLTGQGPPVQVVTSHLSADLFAALGIEPMLGRVFRADEDEPGGPAVAVLGYGLWQQRFGGDPNILYQPITLDGQPYTVVGVMPLLIRQLLTESLLLAAMGPLSANESWQDRGQRAG